MNNGIQKLIRIVIAITNNIQQILIVCLILFKLLSFEINDSIVVPVLCYTRRIHIIFITNPSILLCRSFAKLEVLSIHM